MPFDRGIERSAFHPKPTFQAKTLPARRRVCHRRAAGLRSRQATPFQERTAMRTVYGVNDMTIHRIVEQEQGFTPMLEFLPTLSKELLEENLSWLAPAGYN